MSVVVVCDSCGAQAGNRYYLSVAIGEGKGTRNIAKGDLCQKCADALPFPLKSGEKGRYRERAA